MLPRRYTAVVSALLGAVFVSFGLTGCTGDHQEPPRDEGQLVGQPEDQAQSANDPRVIVGQDGMRSFPTMTLDEQKESEWQGLVFSLEAQGVPVPDRPDAQLIKVFDDNDEYRDAQIRCMHDAGWSDFGYVYEAEQKYFSGGSLTADQMAPYKLSEYVCHVQYAQPPIPWPNEAQMEDYYDHQIGFVIPCLEEHGYTVSNFPSRKALIDEYFVTGEFPLTCELAGAPDDFYYSDGPCSPWPSSYPGFEGN